MFFAKAAASLLALGLSGSMAAEGLTEKLLYHSYSSYEAMDSRLMLCDPRSGIASVLADDSFVHAMNGDFGSHCYDITFMAIDPAADEWDIFYYNTLSRRLVNLTEHSGFRNEDPKFSPDGEHIVFKRGYWSAEKEDFVYDLAMLELKTQEITMLTAGGGEESMPCFSADGTSIYYANALDGVTEIRELILDTGEDRCLYTEDGVHVYYPMASLEGLYFTRWHSAEQRTDCIYRLGDTAPLPFCHAEYNCSDPFPVTGGGMLFSSTAAGSYDLYYHDGTKTKPLTALNTELHELGSSCYSTAEAERIVVHTTDHLLQRAPAEMRMDADDNGRVDAFDLALLKRMALE